MDSTLSVAAEGVTLERDGRVFRFDAAGRLTRVFDGEHVFYRGLDNTVVEKWWEQIQTSDGTARVRRSRQVTDSRREQLLETAYDTVATRLESALSEEAFESDERESIQRVLAQSPETLAAHSERMESLYEPIGVLPPDQYRTVVVQTATGCPYDCSFCTLYGTELDVRSVEEVETHLAELKSFFGRGLRSRRTVFLGDADPLAAPYETLRGTLQTIASELPTLHEGGVNAFLTARTAARLSPEKVEMLAAEGLDRVYIGVESGAESVLDVLRKPQTTEEVLEGVRRLKTAGIAVGVIVLAGVGGQELVTAHLEETSELISSLSLDANDIVYVSPLAEAETDDYSEQLRDRSLSELSETEIAAQTERLRSRLADQTPARVSRYHVADFVYF